MIHIHGARDESVETVDVRYPILVTDWDGDAHVHFLALAPFGMSLTDARAAVTAAYRRVVGDDDWSYDDVRGLLVEAGFWCRAVAVWEEAADG